MFCLVTIFMGLIGIASVSSDCPNGWTTYHNTELCIKGFDQKMDFVEAMDFCAAFGNGGSLVSIHNAFENIHVANAAIEATSDCNIWIGLYNFDGSNTYSWADGSALDYQNWATGYPMSNIEDSMVFLDLSGKNKWVSSYSLMEARCCVCQQKLGQNPQTVAPATSQSTMKTVGTTTPTTTTTSTKAETTTAATTTTATTTRLRTTAYHQCPIYYKYYNGSCYYYNSTAMSYADAESYCAQIDGYLVSILSKEENDYVLGTIGYDSSWLGLVYTWEEAWHWIDDSPFVYTSWDGGTEPDGVFYPYVYTYAERWYGTTSAYNYSVTCKRNMNSRTWA